MNTYNASSSGYITEFNLDTGIGFIQDDTTKQVLFVQLNSFKKRAKRYLTNDNKFIGELFDFDIIVKQKSDDDGNDTFEAVNIRHRVLKCNVEGCPRLKAFTNVKALEDHIDIRHTSRKTKEVTSHSSVSLTKKSKKERRPRPKPVLIELSSHTTAATIGRFIGKQGANLKRFQQQNQVKLKLLDSQNPSNPVQILIKPNAGGTIDMKLVGEKLKVEWVRCVREQKVSDNYREERLKLKKSSRELVFLEFESDSRYTVNARSLHIKRRKRQEALRRRCRQTESLVRVQDRHSSLNQEGHRSLATYDSECRQKSIFNYFQPKKVKKSMKEEQWLFNEHLQNLDRLSVSS